jgi:hypothetical protein
LQNQREHKRWLPKHVPKERNNARPTTTAASRAASVSPPWVGNANAVR